MTSPANVLLNRQCRQSAPHRAANVVDRERIELTKFGKHSTDQLGLCFAKTIDGLCAECCGKRSRQS